MKNLDSKQQQLVIALGLFLVVLFVMCFAGLMSTYNDSIDPEEYDFDPPAVREEDYNDGDNEIRVTDEEEEVVEDDEEETEDPVNLEVPVPGNEDVEEIVVN
jgi:hypothetical protein